MSVCYASYTVLGDGNTQLFTNRSLKELRVLWKQGHQTSQIIDGGRRIMVLGEQITKELGFGI